MLARLPLGAVALLLLLVTPTSAGIPVADQSAKQVSKALKAELQQLQKELGAQIKVATATLDGELGTLAATFKQGDASATDVAGLFFALFDFQAAMVQVAEDAGAVYPPLFTGINSLDPADDSFAGEYPDDFMPGAGGRHDAFLDDVDAALAKPYKKLRKKLDKLRKLAEKKSDLLIAVRIEPVRGVFEQAVNEGASTGGGRRPVTIDLALSAHDSEDLRLLWVSGSATDFGTDLPVVVTGENSSTQDAVFDGNHRYERSFVGLNPGNYRIRVGYQGDDASVASTIGLR